MNVHMSLVTILLNSESQVLGCATGSIFRSLRCTNCLLHSYRAAALALDGRADLLSPTLARGICYHHLQRLCGISIGR